MAHNAMVRKLCKISRAQCVVVSILFPSVVLLTIDHCDQQCSPSAMIVNEGLIQQGLICLIGQLAG